MSNRAERWLLELMADRARRALDPSVVLVILEEGRELQVAAASPERGATSRVVPIEGSALGAIYRAGEAVSFERPLGSQADWLRELGLDAGPSLIQPLAIEAQAFGVLVALRRDESFREADLSTLGALASSLTARLAAERSAEIERLRYGAEARERERERWARELHDETVQGLGVLRMQLGGALEADDPGALTSASKEVLEGLQREIMGIRHLITELRPAALGDLGLQAALEALARRAQAVYGLDVGTEIALGPENDQRRFDAEIETTIYRVLQEALNNVARHAQASEAMIVVGVHDETIVASVSDNGQGMTSEQRVRFEGGSGANGPPGAARAPGSQEAVPTGGFGLPGMRERAQLVGGELTLRSSPDQGTTLRLSVPLRANAPAAGSP